MLIRENSGEVIGAVGVTGDTQDRDEELAAHGIRAAGLKTDADCANPGSEVRLEISKARGVSLQTTARWKEHRAN
jgi:hypothetical protein